MYAQHKTVVYKLDNYGILPNTKEDVGPKIAAVIAELIKKTDANSKIVFKFKKGRYDFYPNDVLVREYFVSNHYQDNPKFIGIALENVHNIVLDGQGADLMFHGRMLPIAIIKGSNVTVKNLSIDFETPHIAQAVVLENDTAKGEIIFEPAKWVNYRIQDSVFLHRGLGWEAEPNHGIAFEKNTKRIVYRAGDVVMGTSRVSEIAPGKIKAHGWKNKLLIPGTVLAMRIGNRPSPALFIDGCKDIHVEHVKVHYVEGMGLLAQMTENIYLDGFQVALRGKHDPRYFTAQADATHFSGCKGVIDSRNGLYEGMMDDAINVHGTYLKVLKKVDDKTVIARYMHDMAYGFDWGFEGDSVQFIRAKTMEYAPNANVIASIIPLERDQLEHMREFKIVFKEPLDKSLDPSMMDIGIENLTWTPEVIFKNNIVRNNRARGALFSSPKKTVVENNIFDHTSGCAILLCGDSNGWYETGACHDVLIRNNKFINALTSMYQFTNGVISIYPEIPDLKNQKQYFHSNIKIEDNEFITFDNPILYAKSVDGITFKRNKIKTNKEYPAFHKIKQRVLFERVIHADISDNKENGKQILIK